MRRFQKHFEPLGLTPDQQQVQFFIYKTLPARRVDVRGNPHVDTYRGGAAVVPARFNILLDGEPDQEMVWWDTAVPWQTDPRLQLVEYPSPVDSRQKWKRIQVLGNNSAERWNLMGQPAHRSRHLTKFNHSASFVRTDVIHALNWTGARPRLMLSIRFFHDWSTIAEKF